MDLEPQFSGDNIHVLSPRPVALMSSFFCFFKLNYTMEIMLLQRMIAKIKLVSDVKLSAKG